MQPNSQNVTLKHLLTLQEGSYKSTDIAWSPNGRYLSVGTNGNHILVWDYVKRCLLRKFGLRRLIGICAKTKKDLEDPAARTVGWIPSVSLNTSWSPEGEVFAYVSRMMEIGVCDTQVELPPEILPYQIQQLMRVAWLPGQPRIAAITMRSLWLFDVHRPVPPAKVCDTGFMPHAMEVAPSGDVLAVSSHTGKVHVFDISADPPRFLTELEGADSPSYGLAWCPRTRRLAACLGDSTIGVFNVNSKERVTTIRGHKAPCLSVAFSPDGTLLASKSVDNTVRLWTCETWEQVTCIDETTDKAFGRIAFHPTEPLLATRGQDDLGIRIWEVVSGQEATGTRGTSRPVAPTRHIATVSAVLGSLRYSGDAETSRIPRQLTDAIRKVKELTPPLIQSGIRRQCFISYARGNSRNEEWIEDLALFLRSECDVDVILDRWHNPPGSSITKFFDGLSESDFVLPIGTPEYKAKYVNEESSPIVDAEIRMINRILSKCKVERERVLPILLAGDSGTSFPALFEDSVFVDCRTDEAMLPNLFELIARIHGIDFSDSRFIRIRRTLNSG